MLLFNLSLAVQVPLWDSSHAESIALCKSIAGNADTVVTIRHLKVRWILFISLSLWAVFALHCGCLRSVFG